MSHEDDHILGSVIWGEGIKLSRTCMSFLTFVILHPDLIMKSEEAPAM